MLKVAANQTWAVDFMHDGLIGGRRFCALAVLDEWSRESLCGFSKLDPRGSGFEEPQDRGASSQGKASVTCPAIHSAVGFGVTQTVISRQLCRLRMQNCWSIRRQMHRTESRSYKKNSEFFGKKPWFGPWSKSCARHQCFRSDKEAGELENVRSC